MSSPEYFSNEMNNIIVRYNLVKQNFLDSFPNYQKKIDTGKNRRAVSQWEKIQEDLHTLKIGLEGQSLEHKNKIEKYSDMVKTDRKLFLNKGKQLEYKERIIKAALPMKTVEYDKNATMIIEGLYYTTALIMMLGFIYKQSSS